MKVFGLISSLIILFLLSGCNDSKDRNSTQNYGEEQLNLTKNPLWDDPVLTEEMSDSFDTYIYASGDSIAYKKVMDFNEDRMTRKEAKKIYPEIKACTNSRYNNYICLLLLNDLMVTMPEETVKADSLKFYMEEGYRLAGKSNPVPLSLFMQFWNNVMLMYSNIDCSDSVYVESERLLKICKRQNIPQGIICTYNALGNCLIDECDYSTAAQQFEIAEGLAKKYFPVLLSTDWEKDSLQKSNMGALYIAMKALHLRSCISSKDTNWIKENESLLTYYSEVSDDVVSINDILYGLAMYYNMTGDEVKFESTIKKSEDMLRKFHIKENINNDGSAYNVYALHLKAIVTHYLRKHDAKKAQQTMLLLPKYFIKKDNSLLASLYAMQGKYKEATEIYQNVEDFNTNLLDGRNRNTLASLASRIDSDSKEMEMIKMQLEQEKTKRLYEGLLLAGAILLIIILIYFYVKKRQQSLQLAEAYKATNQAYKVAKKANETKDIFLKNMSHEIHTPLNHIYGFAQIMADKSMPIDEESTHEMAEGICQGAEQLTKILDNIVEVTDKLSKMDKLEDVASVLDETKQSTYIRGKDL